MADEIGATPAEADQPPPPTKVRRTRRRLYEAPEGVEAGSPPDEPRGGEEAAVSPETGEALGIVRRHMAWSMGIGLLPLPLIDMAAILVVQSRMLRQLARLYAVDYTGERGRVFASSLLGTVLPISVVGSFGGLIRLIPVIGHAARVMMLPAMAGAATYALGRVFIQHFALGGTMLDFDPDSARESFRQRYSEKKLSLLEGDDGG